MKHLKGLFSDGEPQVTVVGGGYVGLPLACSLASSGCRVTVLDVDKEKVAFINAGTSYIDDVPTHRILSLKTNETLKATTNPRTAYEHADAVIICVPTPLQNTRDPDVSMVQSALSVLDEHMEHPLLVVLESTVYPGFTREVVAKTLERKTLSRVIGESLFIAFSPERVDPSNQSFGIENTPKVIGGITPMCMELATLLYSRITQVVLVGSTDVAEMVKLLENTYRSVNIALINEIAVSCDRLGVDVWEVIEAASTKPFGFQKFTPGPGVGGHCIGLDPHYLMWKLRTLHHQARLVELASEVNASMPVYVVDRLARELNYRGLPVKDQRVLVVGVAYKPDVSDVRESPALEIIDELHRRGARVYYTDPHVPSVHVSKGILCSLEPETPWDVAVIVTDHEDFDYQRLADRTKLIFDTRNAMRRRGIEGEAEVVTL